MYRHANNSLRSSWKRERVPHEAHTLVDPSDLIKYSGTTAMIVHSQTTEELKFRLRMERSKAKSSTPYALRWTHICHHFREFQNKLKRKETMDLAIYKVADDLQEKAILGGSETTINRVDFISTCSKIKYVTSYSSCIHSHI